MHELKSAIAVVGMSGRFAGADDIEAFWDGLCRGRSGIRRFGRDELLARGVPASVIDSPGYVPAGAQFDGMELFDAAFFEFTPREAEVCGPQQRLLLECAHRALENAGCAVDKLDGRVGAFVGVTQSNYLHLNLATHPELAQTVGARTVQFGNDVTFAATQLAYKLDLKGPAISVATACSTSLVAIHLARNSLLGFECDVAIAGGAQISVEHDRGYHYHEGGIHSPDGHCRTFDAAAQGTVSGNGVGVVVLRRLEDAIADGDPILAVLRATALCNDGHDKVGYSAPSVRGQATAIAEAQALAGVHPDAIGYVEAHGTATPLGDPIEIAALTEAFGLHTQRRGYCAIGSLKSNLGHMGAAAGVGGFMKAVLAVERGRLPPSLDFERANPALELERTPFFVNAALREWDIAPDRRIAGVSSFGMGGTNAHAIVSGCAARASGASPRVAQPIVISAKSEAALADLQGTLAGWLRARPEVSLADVAYSLAVGRRDYRWRRAIVADSCAALIDACERPDGGARAAGSAPGLVFAFPGQGAQHGGMAAQVYTAEPAFRAAIDECAVVIRRCAGIDVLDYVSGSGDLAALERTEVAQPVLFAIEYAYARLWLSFGLEPDAMIGHSLGEYVAATLAGVFELDAALELVCARGRLMQAMAPGAMLSVALPEARLRDRLGPDVSLAAVNGPELCVLSGRRNALERIASELESAGVACQWMKVQHAFHSALMEPMLAEFRECVRRATPSAPRRAFVSNVTGALIDAADARDPDYWVRQVRGAVRFHEGIESLRRGDDRHFLEVGPGQVLKGLLARAGVPAQRVSASAPHARNAGGDGRALLVALGELWAEGHSVDWKAVFAAERRLKLALPGHPLQRKRHWIEPRRGPAAPTAQLASLASDDVFHAPTWRQLPLLAADSAAASRALWIVLADAGDVSDALVRRLRARGSDVLVLNGTGCETPGLDARLESADSIHVISLRSADAALAPVRQVADQALPLLRVLEALAPHTGQRPIRVSALSTHAYAVRGDESVTPATAAAWAALRVASQEYAELRTCHADIDPSRDVDSIAADVLAEHDAGLPEPVVAWRNGRRHVREFLPVAVPRAPEHARLKEGGVYLITGGLGGIGLVLARFLATRWRARLVLVGRTPVPAAAEWRDWLATHPADHRTSQVVSALMAIEAAGAELLVLAADVSDRASVDYVAQRAKARFGRVDGVIHAAGVGDAQLLRGLDEGAIARAAEAKVAGVEHLHAVFGDALDFMLLCSSQNAIKGGIGKLGYCAANAYLDAFAERHAAHGRYPVVSLNWCAWREAGMAAQGGALDERRRRESIGNDEATAIFARAVAYGAPRLVVSKFALAPVLAEFDDLQRAQREAMSDHARAASAGAERPGGLSQAYVAPASLVEQQLCAIWADVLGIHPIGALDDFFELGGSSLLVTQVALRVKEYFSIGVGLQGLFAALTVREQAAHVVALQAESAGGAQLEDMLAELEALSDDDITELLNA